MKTIEIPIADIVLYEKNSNKHSPKQIERLTAMIREYGFLVPCVVKSRGDGKYDLAAGHGRLVAAKRAKMKAVPCILADHLTEKQFQAFVIADNQIAKMGEWNLDLLQSELAGLLDDGFDYELLGFDADEAERILSNSAQDARTDTEGGGAASNAPTGEEKGGAALRTNIAYNIIFDTDEQQQAWFGFLRYLKATVDAESIGARLRVFIADGDFTKE